MYTFYNVLMDRIDLIQYNEHFWKIFISFQAYVDQYAYMSHFV